MSEPTIRPRRRMDVAATPQEIADQTVHEGYVTVTRANYYMKEETSREETTETVRVPLFSTEPGRLRVVAGTTRNLGDFNSARVEVMIEVPCYPVESEYRRAYAFAEALLDELVPQELAKAGVATE